MNSNKLTELSLEVKANSMEKNGKSIVIVGFVFSKHKTAGSSFQDYLDSFTPEENQCLIIDLANLSYIDSSFIAKIGDTHKIITSKNGKLILINVIGSTKKLLEITRLDKFFNIQPSLESALETIS